MILNQAGSCFRLALSIAKYPDFATTPAGKACTGRKLIDGSYIDSWVFYAYYISTMQWMRERPIHEWHWTVMELAKAFTIEDYIYLVSSLEKSLMVVENGAICATGMQLLWLCLNTDSLTCKVLTWDILEKYRGRSTVNPVYSERCGLLIVLIEFTYYHIYDVQIIQESKKH